MAELRIYLEGIYGDQIQSTYRHFTLSFHEKAEITGEAVEAAGAQGKFWEMHDLLYERQQEWNQVELDQMPDKLAEYADELGLDTEQFSSDLEEHVYLDKVQADTADAAAAGLPGTPSYIINGRLYPANEMGLHPALVSNFIRLLDLIPRQYTEVPPEVIDPDKQYMATIETEDGDIVIELFADQVPVTVNSFVFLAQEGWYDDTEFFRVIPEFVAQTGDPSNTGMGGPGYRCDDEIVSDLGFDEPGMVGMASAGPGTGSVGSQFFITYDALPQLSGNYTVIGRVVEGMDIVEGLTPRDPNQDPTAPPGDPIETITIEEE